MARTLTTDEAIRLLDNVPGAIVADLEQGMNQCVLLGEGQAKVNCGYISGVDGPAPADIPNSPYLPCPYETPPRQEGHLARANHGWVEKTENGSKTQIVGRVGNSQSEYNVHVHEGTALMEGRPFLYDAAMMQGGNFLKLISASVVRGLKRAGGRQ
jgi:hypothetical protein